MRSARIAGASNTGSRPWAQDPLSWRQPGALEFIEALGGRFEVIANRFYAHARASVTVILPPVGARAAIQLLECIERYFGHPIFHIRGTRSKVCSPCRLDGPRAAILAIAFYLGSDFLRRYSLDDLTTTFSEDTFRRHSIEDAASPSMTARATSTGTSNGGSLKRIASRYCRTAVREGADDVDVPEQDRYRDIVSRQSLICHGVCPMLGFGGGRWCVSSLHWRVDPKYKTRPKAATFG